MIVDNWKYVHDAWFKTKYSLRALTVEQHETITSLVINNQYRYWKYMQEAINV